MKSSKLGFVITQLIVLVSLLLLTGCSSRNKEEPKNEGVKARESLKSKKLNVDKVKVKKDSHLKWIHYKEKCRIPILMYHSISAGNALRVPPKQFEEEMAYLKANQYYTLSTDEAIKAFETNSLPQKKVVWITLDDAYKDNYTAAFPILKKYHLHATINYITSFSQKPNHLTLSEAKTMQHSGLVDFQSHTVQHLDLNALSTDVQKQELANSKKYLDDNLKQNTRMICYPAGRYNQTTIRLANHLGYKIGLTTNEGLACVDQGWYSLARVRIAPGIDRQTFMQLLQNGY
ncbi:polysaccharide deacetylase [Liquorilactobacillus sucicola DSM 21376 = JCM 15457]|uniref:polysaccharide deacetylase family protein n=1 Tax=Liquorilactobacillus sucicola TaxID=519050 RepID=UPI0004325163|nr:polysaccharide deacetylase family protein [Liquorilactobacillus sucicola]GAJ25706.1 polysaccharide deacetylase [Liquorilactobacillus sucicola DSM 21376 = JCM 15457]